MKNSARFSTLKTPDFASGMALSTELAQEISQSLASGRQSVAKPGGMNYLEPAPVPTELIASILMVAVSIANDGWSK